MPLIANVQTLLSHPAMIPAFARWSASAKPPGPIVHFDNGTHAAGWTSFTEYWMRRGGIEIEDRSVVAWCFKHLGPAATAPGSTAFDIGGNIGLFSLVLAAAGFPRVIAFEPVPFNATRFQDNLSRNPTHAAKIQLQRMATGAAPGQIEFYVNRISPGTCKIANALDIRPDDEKIIVPITTVDAVCSEHNVTRIPFMKIDVEGFELGVLQGAQGMLSRKAIDFIFMEVIHEAWRNAGYSASDIYNLLTGHGYRPMTTHPDGSPAKEIRRDEFLPNPPPSPATPSGPPPNTLNSPPFNLSPRPTVFILKLP